MLNYFLPGAGLVCLGRPLARLVNFLAVAASWTVVYWQLPPEMFKRYSPAIGLALQVGSALVAFWLAQAPSHGGDEQPSGRDHARPIR